MRRLTGLLLALPLLGALAAPTAAMADPVGSAEGCPPSGPAVCFTEETHTERVTVPAAGTAETTYAHFTARVVNAGPSTATHFTITASPDGAFRNAVATASTAGGRTASCAGLVCSYGNLPAFASASIDLLVQVVPGTTAAAGSNTFTLSLAEGTNDTTNGGKGDQAPLTRSVLLAQHDGTAARSYLPKSTGTTLTTERNGKPFGVATANVPGSTVNTAEVGTTVIPGLPGAADVSLALVGDTEAGASCSPSVPCAMQHWMHAAVPGVQTSGGYLRTTVRVDSSRVATVKGLSASTVAVRYRPDASTTTETQTLAKCTFAKGSATPSNAVVGCYTATKEKDGDLTVLVWEPHNGLIKF